MAPGPPLYASPHDLALELTAVLMLWLGLSVWQRDRRASAGLCFLGLTAGVLLWCVGALAVRWEHVGSWGQQRLMFLGILAVPPLWLAVSIHAAGLDIARRVPWFPLVLLAPSAVLYTILHMGPWSNLFLVNTGAGGSSGGPLFRVWTFYAYALVTIGIALFALAAARWPRRGLSSRIVALAIGVSIPLAGNALYVFGDMGWARDPTPLLIGLAVIPLRSAIFSASLLDVLPVDQRNLLAELPVGIVLADEAVGVLDLNPHAERHLGMSRKQAVGRSLEAVLTELPASVGVHVAALGRHHGRTLCAVIGGPGERADGAGPWQSEALEMLGEARRGHRRPATGSVRGRRFPPA